LRIIEGDYGKAHKFSDLTYDVYRKCCSL